MFKKSFIFASIIYFFNSLGNVTQGVLIKYYQGNLSIGLYEMIAIKCFVAMIIMFPFAFKYIKNCKKDLHIVLLLAILYSGDVLFCNIGFKTVPINTGVLILLLVPLWIVVFGRIILNEKSFNIVNALALIVCFVGVFLPIKSEIGFNGFNIGYIFLFMASIIIPLGLILQKKFKDCRPVPYALFTNALVLGIIGLILESINISMSNGISISINMQWITSLNKDKLIAGLFVAICDLVEFAGVYIAYQMAEAALLQPIRFTRILLSIALSWMILKEQPTQAQIIGAVLILFANAVSIIYSQRKQSKN